VNGVVDVGRIRTLDPDGRIVWAQRWASYVEGHRLGYHPTPTEAQERIRFFREHGR
jgi:hypothetical protein